MVLLIKNIKCLWIQAINKYCMVKSLYQYVLSKTLYNTHGFEYKTNIWEMG